MRLGKSIIQDIIGAFPGIDESMSYAQVMKYVYNIHLIHYNL